MKTIHEDIVKISDQPLIQNPTPLGKIPVTPALPPQTMHYVKTAITSLVIFVSSLLLGNTIVDFVEKGDYFGFSVETAILFVVYSVILLVAFALSIGCWNKYDQYLFVLVPLVLGVFFSMEHLDPVQSLTFASVFGLIFMFYMYRSLKLKSLLLQFVPNLIFSDAVRVMLLLFSLMSAFAIFINFENIEQPKSLADYVTQVVSKEVQNLGGGPLEMLDSANVPLDEIIKTNVETFLGPFKKFTTPIIAFLIFSYFQLLAWITYSIYAIIIEPIFWLGKKYGMYKIEYEDVKRENLTY